MDDAGPATIPVNPGLVPFEVVAGLVVLVDVGVLEGLEDEIRAGTTVRPEPTRMASRSGMMVFPCLNMPFNWLTPPVSVFSYRLTDLWCFDSIMLRARTVRSKIRTASSSTLCTSRSSTLQTPFRQRLAPLRCGLKGQTGIAEDTARASS